MNKKLWIIQIKSIRSDLALIYGVYEKKDEMHKYIGNLVVTSRTIALL